MSRSFLIINPYGIGDVLFSTPLIRQLHDAFPAARIYYLCNRRTSTFLQHHPLLQELFIYERDEFKATQKRSFWAWLKMFASFIYSIRRARIHTSIDLSLHAQFSFYALLAGIPERVGLDYKKRGWLFTKKIPINGYNSKHVAEYYLDTLKPLGIVPQIRPMEIYTDEKTKAWAKNVVSHEKLVIGIAPCGGQTFGSSAGVMRWPENRYAELMNRLEDRYHPHIFLFAGPKEKAEVGNILKQLTPNARAHALDCADRSLAEIIALAGHCDLFIGNDTGPRRFAEAQGKKIVAFFGPVDERVYGPFPYDPERHRVLTHAMVCRPCYQRFRLRECHHALACITDIPVEEALKACEELLDKK